MRKAKILSFVSFTAAFFLHIGLTNGIEAYEPYQRIGSAMITLTFAAVLFYFGLCGVICQNCVIRMVVQCRVLCANTPNCEHHHGYEAGKEY